jgi:hypothetical protein
MIGTPVQARAQFLAYWQSASHGTQQFGSGQAVATVSLRGFSPAVAQHIAAINHETFAQAFLNGTRPAMVAVMIALVAGALIATRLRGGRTAQESRRLSVTAALCRGASGRGILATVRYRQAPVGGPCGPVRTNRDISPLESGPLPMMRWHARP